MGFLGVFRAIYDYAPQSDGELAITEGSLLYILDKDGGDGWWKAKMKATGDDEEEPEGLIPNNYVEEAKPLSHARALYEYTRQTDEELSFPEDVRLAIYDSSDPDWILAGYEGEYGFVPANYIDLNDSSAAVQGAPGAAAAAVVSEVVPPALPTRQAAPTSPVAAHDSERGPSLPPRGVSSPDSSASGPASALASVLVGRTAPALPPPAVSIPARPRYLSDASEDDLQSPPLPSRPRPQSRLDEDGSTAAAIAAQRSPPLPQRSLSIHRPVYGDSNGHDHGEEVSRSNTLSPGAFHLYNISEMVSVMGKRKKMPTTIGINLKTGMILIAPERQQDGPSQEWSADKMTHYSREGKHVFLELVRPSKSIDFHAGAKDTAEEIVAALGELAGAVRAQGLREVILAGSGHDLKKAVVLYDFTAQGEDEVTVVAGDEVIVLDDRSSEEWCQVRRIKNGKEGVVPSSYVEVSGPLASPTAGIPLAPAGVSSASSLYEYTPRPSSPTTTTSLSAASANATARGTVAQNRMEEERMTRQAVRAAVRDEASASRRASEVGPYSPDDALPLHLARSLPERRSSLGAVENSLPNGSQHRSGKSGNRSKSKPDGAKVRTWTDRTKSFNVEAQFLGLKDGKINLHKMNGVKIAVPVSKMSIEDIEYVEQVTGVSLDEDKPLSSMKRRTAGQRDETRNSSGTKVGASIEPKKPEYDWFQFFLSCDVALGLCERYSQSFIKDNMDESVLPDIDAGVLRTLGLREGDIIKVMRTLDGRFGRTKKSGGDGDVEGGGLFSGPGGTLRNNTRRGRPTPTTQASDVVDATALKPPGASEAGGSNGSANGSSAAQDTPPDVPAAKGPSTSGGSFEDDAWDVKPSRQPAPAAASAQQPVAAGAAVAAAVPLAATAPAVTPALTGSLQELSLLTQPLPAEKLNPTPTVPAGAAAPAVSVAVTPPATVGPTTTQMPGATPGFFGTIAAQQTGMAMGGMQPQQTGIAGFGLGARARPVAPQYTQSQVNSMSGLLPPPPPTRPLSAPQSAQPSAFGPPPLQPQITGIASGQVAPHGQSLNDMTQMRLQQQQLQQQQQQMMAQQTGMMPMMTGMPQQQSPFLVNQFGQQQPMMMQPTGFQPQQQPTGINSMLPPALEPQRTAMPMQSMGGPMGMGMNSMGAMGMGQQMPQQLQPQQTGHFTQGFGNYGLSTPTSIIPPPIPAQSAPAPLMQQKTGPPPPVRFGVTDEQKKLTVQPTGRRANLSAATPENPFGF